MAIVTYSRTRLVGSVLQFGAFALLARYTVLSFHLDTHVPLMGISFDTFTSRVLLQIRPWSSSKSSPCVRTWSLRLFVLLATLCLESHLVELGFKM